MKSSGSCNTMDDLLGRICVPIPSKIEDVNLKGFNMISDKRIKHLQNISVND